MYSLPLSVCVEVVCADLCEPGLYGAVMRGHCSPPPGEAQPLQGLQQVIQGLLLPQAGALVRQMPQLQSSLSSLARHLFYAHCTCGAYKNELAQGFWLRASCSQTAHVCIGHMLSLHRL